MRSGLASLAAGALLALAAISCGSSQTGSARAAAAVAPREVQCTNGECPWLLGTGACQDVASALGLPGQYGDVHLIGLAPGLATTTVSGGETFAATVHADGKTFDWTATRTVDFVVASAMGFDSNVYVYPSPVTSDTGLTAAGAPDEKLIQILFCLGPAAPPPQEGCTYTQGYWKTHSQEGPAPYDDRWENLGADQERTLFFQSGQTWLEVFQTPVEGRAYYALAHQYMAAKLNALAGASTDKLGDALAAAAAFFEANEPTTELTPAQRDEALALAAILDRFNSGEIGPGHCP